MILFLILCAISGCAGIKKQSEATTIAEPKPSSQSKPEATPIPIDLRGIFKGGKNGEFTDYLFFSGNTAYYMASKPYPSSSDFTDKYKLGTYRISLENGRTILRMGTYTATITSTNTINFEGEAFKKQ